MRPSELFALHRDEIRRIILSHRGVNPRIFGSVAQGTDTEDSDLDIIVDPLKEMTIFDIGAIRCEILELLGNIRIDVVTPDALPEAWRSIVVAEALPI